MKTLKILNVILLLSVLLFSTCSKEDDRTPKNDDQQLIGVWLPEIYYYSFLFSYNQGFELSEDSIYFPVLTPFHAAPIDTTFTINKEGAGNWYLNESQDTITFTGKFTESIIFRILKLTKDSLVFYGRAYMENSKENKEYLFLKKKKTI